MQNALQWYIPHSIITYTIHVIFTQLKDKLVPLFQAYPERVQPHWTEIQRPTAKDMSVENLEIYFLKDHPPPVYKQNIYIFSTDFLITVRNLDVFLRLGLIHTRIHSYNTCCVYQRIFSLSSFQYIQSLQYTVYCSLNSLDISCPNLPRFNVSRFNVFTFHVSRFNVRASMSHRHQII